MIAEFKGQNGKIMVFDDHLAISHATVGGFIGQGGFSGERKFYYPDITSFEYKKPTLFANGYFKVIVPGTHDTSATVGLLGSSAKSMADANTIVLRAFSGKVGEEADKVHQLITAKIADAKKSRNAPAAPAVSKMDELKKLGELKQAGILTEEEFAKEKERLLNS